MQPQQEDSNVDKHRILVIDDAPVIREMLIEVLSDDGYIVDTAVDGEKGAAAALEADFSVIICDVHMPRMNGLETVREIISHKPDAKIILTDSYPDKLANQARREGALMCLQKPFEVNELRDLLRRLIAGENVTVGR